MKFDRVGCVFINVKVIDAYRSTICSNIRLLEENSWLIMIFIKSFIVLKLSLICFEMIVWYLYGKTSTICGWVNWDITYYVVKYEGGMSFHVLTNICISIVR